MKKLNDKQIMEKIQAQSEREERRSLNYRLDRISERLEKIGNGVSKGTVRTAIMNAAAATIKASIAFNKEELAKEKEQAKLNPSIKIHPAIQSLKYLSPRRIRNQLTAAK